MNGQKKLFKHSQNNVENIQMKCIQVIYLWLIMDVMIIKNRY